MIWSPRKLRRIQLLPSGRSEENLIDSFRRENLEEPFVEEVDHLLFVSRTDSGWSGNDTTVLYLDKKNAIHRVNFGYTDKGSFFDKSSIAEEFKINSFVPPYDGRTDGIFNYVFFPNNLKEAESWDWLRHTQEGEQKFYALYEESLQYIFTEESATYCYSQGREFHIFRSSKLIVTPESRNLPALAPSLSVIHNKEITEYFYLIRI